MLILFNVAIDLGSGTHSASLVSLGIKILAPFVVFVGSFISL